MQNPFTVIGAARQGAGRFLILPYRRPNGNPEFSENRRGCLPGDSPSPLDSRQCSRSGPGRDGPPRARCAGEPRYSIPAAESSSDTIAAALASPMGSSVFALVSIE